MGVVPEVRELFQNHFIRLIRTFADVELSENPDFLICGAYGTDHWKYSCVKIFYCCEELEPNFNIYDYAIGKTKITFHDRYFCEPYYLSVRFIANTQKALQKHEYSEDFFFAKKKFCNFIYSNPDADPFRAETFRALNDYKHVDSAGKFLNNMGSDQIAGERFSGNWEEQKIRFMQQYRFTIAFGNAQKYDYVDEKIFDAWNAGTIPIFWGDPKFKERFNPKSYIDCCDCTEPQEVVERVRRIEENPKKYIEMQREPILYPNDPFREYILKNLVEEELKEFLKHILTQSPKQARRISQGVLQRVYIRDQETLASLKETLPYRLYRKYKVPKSQTKRK